MFVVIFNESLLVINVVGFVLICYRKLHRVRLFYYYCMVVFKSTRDCISLLSCYFLLYHCISCTYLKFRSVNRNNAFIYFIMKTVSIIYLRVYIVIAFIYKCKIRFKQTTQVTGICVLYITSPILFFLPLGVCDIILSKLFSESNNLLCLLE